MNQINMFSYQSYFTFVNFKSQKWAATLQAISQPVSDFEELKEKIKHLQKLNWGYKDITGLEHNECNREEFILIYDFCKDFITSLEDFFPEGVLNYSPNPYQEYSREKCVALLSTLFFACSEQVHTFFNQRELAKFKCITSYFRLVQASPKLLQTVISIERKALSPPFSIEHWLSLEDPLLDYEIDPVAKIEDYPNPALKVDFANQFIGGGVLQYGCVQEEILFSIYPEMLISMLLCERMNINEAITLTGVLRVANYSGYGWSFTYESQCVEHLDLNEKFVVMNKFVAIDAMMCQNLDSQFERENILRELNKAFIGFSKDMNEVSDCLDPVVTGKWGCGEFGGFPPLKMLLQWISASYSKRKIVMITFNDHRLIDLEKVMAKYKSKPIGELLRDIMKNDVPELFDVLLGKIEKPERKVIKINLPSKLINSK